MEAISDRMLYRENEIQVSESSFTEASHKKHLTDMDCSMRLPLDWPPLLSLLRSCCSLVSLHI